MRLHRKIAAVPAVMLLILLCAVPAYAGVSNANDGDHWTKNFWDPGTIYGFQVVVELPNGLGDGANGAIIFQSGAPGYDWFSKGWQVDGSGNAYSQGNDAGISIKTSGNRVTVTYAQEEPLPLDSSSPWCNVCLQGWWYANGDNITAVTASLINTPPSEGDDMPPYLMWVAIACIGTAGAVASVKIFREKRKEN